MPRELIAVPLEKVAAEKYPVDQPAFFISAYSVFSMNTVLCQRFWYEKEIMLVRQVYDELVITKILQVRVKPQPLNEIAFEQEALPKNVVLVNYFFVDSAACRFITAGVEVRELLPH
jgi:hypothetical protein